MLCCGNDKKYTICDKMAIVARSGVRYDISVQIGKEDVFMKPTLVIMAAGMGSRFGGLKQLTPVGPSGQMIIDYSIFDAIRAGFGKIVFVIKHEIEKDFRELIGDRIAEKIDVEYVFQELDKLPEGYTVPEGRKKPWGTAHAIMLCRGVVKEPFVVINADDFYGNECYRILGGFLANPPKGDKLQFAMAGYILKNTLTENGSVARGVCKVSGDGKLLGLDERTCIEYVNGKPMFTEDGGATYEPLSEDCTVSMNAWAFPADMLDLLEERFEKFLATTAKENPLKSECYLPLVVNDMIAEGIAEVTVLQTTDRWYGMTYAADREDVSNAIAAMTEQGQYPVEM